MATSHPIPSNPRFKNRTGKQYDQLTVLGYSGNRNWLCRCTCGNEVTVRSSNLASRNTRSCGCLQSDVTIARNTKHSHAKSPEYQKWCAMISRSRKLGILICPRWQSSFTDFLSDMGPLPTPDHYIQRFPDPTGEYSSQNCRWSSTSIPLVPFPDSIDRTYFGAWLSGFTDGEGCFSLRWSRYKDGRNQSPRACFSICLRADDQATLSLIQSYLGCGTFKFTGDSPERRPHVRLQISRISDLHNKVVSHFERFPLIAKKSHDFTIWKQAVAIIYSTRDRRTTAKFSTAEIAEIDTAINSLSHSHAFKA